LTGDVAASTLGGCGPGHALIRGGVAAFGAVAVATAARACALIGVCRREPGALFGATVLAGNVAASTLGVCRPWNALPGGGVAALGATATCAVGGGSPPTREGGCAACRGWELEVAGFTDHAVGAALKVCIRIEGLYYR